MSLSRPAWPAGPAWPVSSEPPPEDPAAASPSSKRRRLKEPDAVSEAGWPLLLVPRLSEVEKVWEWSLRPFTAFLIPKILWGSGGGRQRCDLGCQDRTFQTQSCWQSGISGRRAGCSRASRRSREAGLRDREAQGVCLGDQPEVSHTPPNTPMPYAQGVKQEPEELPEKETILKEKNSARQPGNLFLDVTFSEETKSALHEIKDRCKVDSVITSEKKENVSSSTLKISKFQNQACLESAKPSYFRDSITKNFPEFPRDLNSNMSFVYLKEIAKKKNDKIVAYVRDFTNIFWSQNRPDAKKQKLQKDKKNVYVENDFSYYSQSNYQSLTIEGKIDLINSNYYRPSSIKCDIRDSRKNFTLTLQNANWEGTERNQDYYIPTRQEKSQSSTAKKRKLLKVEHVLEGSKKQNINSFTMTTKSFLIYKACEDVPILMDFDNMEELSYTQKPSYENSSCAERLLNMENLAYYSFGIGNTHVKSDPLFIQNNCGHTNEKYYESGMYNQDLDTERKWNNKTIHFIFKFIFEDVFNVRQLGTLLCQNTSHGDQINAMAITLNLSLENLLSEIEETIYDFVLKKEMKVTKSSSSCQTHKAIDIEKEENSSPPMDRMSSVQSASLVSKSINVEETKSVNQNNGTSTKEDVGIFQESELANSKHFHPKNESALYANYQFERDSSGENNECFQDLTAKCLSTETLPVAKEFEMKSKFDLVLEELRMFHEISKENEIPSTMETNNRKENYFGESNESKEARMEIGKKLEMVETNTRDAPFLPCDVKAGLNKHKRHQSLFHWKRIPTHGGQAVPEECCSRAEGELLHSTPEEDYKKSLPKSPTFSSDECTKEALLKGGRNFSHGISRVQPLKTCSRPIRVGLSRRARLKQLHPYLK